MIRATLIALTIVSLSGCAPIVTRGVAGNCSAMVPQSWALPVPPADPVMPEKLPDGHDDARPWQKGFIEQTAAYEKAVDRDTARAEIFANCEKQQADALKRDTRRSFLGIKF